ncbi:conserved hypothetical protein [Leishmania infantum JPCM5]|uniref:Uncharacterized protein n=2 Tax=Leishmania infantum TaxID=5671 RepID=A4IE51_LEIIN|nr:conserved hypothetical protein [Leishmania infantum JPCM5]CAC9551731.1 hypothetical_protein_-_conserved [Leishmania infantum]CAM73142.1 conserved hypothetical protein [Leishmania infantum JPCM5]SUZ46823.1 hypothetical_protein_-_conserved [Leishmania infantum]|eukprot:XP_001470020.1 conserved hypothetical protein [Leishmania infantum JPCM5]
MEDACLFQPQINPRSRRLARHAPTLRERQEQDAQRRSAGREGHHGQPLRGAPTPSPGPEAFAADTESDIVESVWGLWRGVAIREARETEAALVRRVHSVNNDDLLPQRRPRVVYVTAVLGMLNALGITSPRHDALIAKFLKAMAVEGGASEATKRDATVDAARFEYVFSTVWRAAVTHRTPWSPVPAQVSVSPRSPPAVQQCGNSPNPATMRHAYPREVSRRGVPPSHMKAAPATEVGSSGGSGSAVSARSSSSPSAVCSSSEGGEEAAHSGTESASPLTSCGSGDERRSDAAESDADFLRTNIYDASPSIPDSSEKPQAGARSKELSPMSVEPSAGLDPSPEPRNPGEPVITPARSSVTPRTHHCSPFAAASRFGSASVSRSRRMSSSLRVIPSDSHLLSSTTSRELKRATKRVPGGLMRECTFKPVINTVYEQMPVSFSSTAIVQRRKSASTARPTFQPNTQQFHQARDSLACWTGQPVKDSGDYLGKAAANPLATGVETAVRRMIAARQQQQRSQSPRPSLQKGSHHSAPAPQSAVRAPVAHPRKPLLYVDVDLPQGQRDRLALYTGDDVQDVAQRFSILHGLSESLCQRLETALTAELCALSVGKAA